MDTGQTLPARMYLLAYDLGRDKPSGRPWLGYAVQGAALTELLAEGLLIDAGAAVIPAVERPAGEILGLVWQQAVRPRPHGWRGLLRQGRATLAAVEDQLILEGMFEPKGRGLVAMDREAIAGLQTRARQILCGEAGDEGGAVLDAALVAVASVIPLRTVYDRRRRSQDRERVDVLTRRVSLKAPGFDRLLRQMRHTRGRSYPAGGAVF
ncbi:MAG TPA: GPP34 family phosphoprotein [Streptosporangiaceae bacterium]|nr:GPP34 family phosphoprotein [Streptosporangiaceae bacterium]